MEAKRTSYIPQLDISQLDIIQLIPDILDHMLRGNLINDPITEIMARIAKGEHVVNHVLSKDEIDQMITILNNVTTIDDYKSMLNVMASSYKKYSTQQANKQVDEVLVNLFGWLRAEQGLSLGRFAAYLRANACNVHHLISFGVYSEITISNIPADPNACISKPEVRKLANEIGCTFTKNDFLKYWRSRLVKLAGFICGALMLAVNPFVILPTVQIELKETNPYSQLTAELPASFFGKKNLCSAYEMAVKRLASHEYPNVPHVVVPSEAVSELAQFIQAYKLQRGRIDFGHMEYIGSSRYDGEDRKELIRENVGPVYDEKRRVMDQINNFMTMYVVGPEVPLVQLAQEQLNKPRDEVYNFWMAMRLLHNVRGYALMEPLVAAANVDV